MTGLKKAAVAVLVSASVVVPTSLLAVPQAWAQSNCRAGTWGGIYGWGDCRGSGKWQVKVSCTWGGQNTSAVITGPGHVDVKCNRGSARNASIIYL